MDRGRITIAAIRGVTKPAMASGTQMTLYTTATPKFCKAMARARRPVSIASTTGASLAPWNTKSAARWLISAALAGEIEACAADECPARH